MISSLARYSTVASRTYFSFHVRPALIMPAPPMMRTALRTGERRSLCFNLHADIDVASLHTFPFIAGDGNKQRRNPQH
ncbi:MAG TPA: hypothetical protein VE734_04275 [Terriglobales bacterium]|nr:hypothetical protein [Terriglobales bacterium]